MLSGGLLTTHGAFFFHRDSNFRKTVKNPADGLETYHVCSLKKKGCPAKAKTVTKKQMNKNGEEEEVTELVWCSRPEVHAIWHEPDQANVIAAKMNMEMVQLSRRVGHSRRTVLLKYKPLYERTDPDLWSGDPDL